MVDRTYDGSFGWPKLTLEDAHALHTFFHDCGFKTWQTLCSETVKGLAKHHAQSIGTLEKEAQDRLKALKLDDLDELFRFRLTGTRRLWGFRGDGDEFFVLWWDPNHKVYIVEKT